MEALLGMQCCRAGLKLRTSTASQEWSRSRSFVRLVRGNALVQMVVVWRVFV